MSERLLLWFRALSRRERRLVLGGGVIVVPAIGYFLVVPLNDALDAARARHADAVIALGETQVRVDAVKAAQVDGAGPPDAPLETLIRQRASDAGFALANVAPQGSDGVRISIASARPGALTGWIADLEASGMLVERLGTTDNGDRTVAVQMVLRARGR